MTTAYPSPAPARFATTDEAVVAAARFDLKSTGPDFVANPIPTYHALREHTPVARMPDGSWFLSGYADCVAVYKDAKLFSSDKKAEFGPKFGDGLLY
jgi:cytochrome P450